MFGWFLGKKSEGKNPGVVELRTPVKEIPTKVAGVSKKNPDGTRRQTIIEGCRIGEDLELHHEPNNPYDGNAIAVYARRTSKQIGYLNARLASETVRRMKKGMLFSAEITDITGGGETKTLGVNIEIKVYEPE